MSIKHLFMSRWFCVYSTCYYWWELSPCRHDRLLCENRCRPCAIPGSHDCRKKLPLWNIGLIWESTSLQPLARQYCMWKKKWKAAAQREEKGMIYIFNYRVSRDNCKKQMNASKQEFRVSNWSQTLAIFLPQSLFKFPDWKN